MKCVILFPCFVQGIQQELCPVHTTRHSSTLDMADDSCFLLFRHYAECQGEHTGVE